MLPLAHCCDAFDSIPIIHDKTLPTSECDVFEKEELLYLFYGKPSYRSNTSDGKSVGLSSFFPVCFLISTAAIPTPKRIFPFDSGAFSGGLFRDFCHPRMKIDDFLLGNSLELAAKCVGLFYGGNEQYFYGRPINATPSPGNFEEESFRALIGCPRSAESDDRLSAIEIQVDSDVALERGNVHLVVMPRSLADEPTVKATICNEWSCEFRLYDTYRCNPVEYHGAIMREVAEYLRTWGHF